MDNTGISRGRQNRWPLALDRHDPKGMASFTLGLGYGEDDVVNTLVSRCNLDRIEAQRIVTDVALHPQGGQL